MIATLHYQHKPHVSCICRQRCYNTLLQPCNASPLLIAIQVESTCFSIRFWYHKMSFLAYGMHHLALAIAMFNVKNHHKRVSMGDIVTRLFFKLGFACGYATLCQCVYVCLFLIKARWCPFRVRVAKPCTSRDATQFHIAFSHFPLSPSS